MSVWTQPSPSDFDRWEARLLEGEEPSQAARAEGQTCSAFKRADPTRHAEALAASREIRAGEDREYVREKLRANIEASMARDDGNAANKGLELLGRHAGMFEDHSTVEVAHSGVVQVEHERRLTLADVAAFDRALDGPEPGTVRELPSPRALAEPATG